MVNRYFEQNPVLTKDVVALISRPGMRHFTKQGSGPVRASMSFPGAFSTDDLFFVSGLILYRYGLDGTITTIGQIGAALTDGVTMAATGNIGSTPSNLFITDGGVLWVYTEDGFARATLTATGAIANNDVININATYYKWTNGSVDAGTPAGTLANPWLVALGISNATALDAMFKAVNDTGVAGTTYSTALTAHTTVQGYSATSSTLSVRAFAYGTTGNTYPTTETGANIAWGGVVMADGGTPSILQVQTPDDVAVVSIAHIASYIIVVPAQGQGINGQFFWIEPGETTIDPLNFATAERSPDPVYQVVVFSDQFWLCGQNTTETWIMTGDPDAPVQRVQGILFDQGTWPGTAIQVKQSLILTTPEGAVFQIGNGQKRISTPDIEERIGRAIRVQATSGF